VTAPVGLAGIEHIVVLMLENRSFDHMLGYLYSENGNVSPRGDAFDGLTGRESCPDATGNPISVYRITPDTPHTYLMPGADPGEGFAATNAQLFGTETPAPGAKETNQGFVRNYAKAIAANRAKHWYVVPGTTPEMIMGCYAPETLPVLSALARSYAVCDHWFCSAPTMTMPNRAFACAGTSQGHLDDHTKIFTVPSIFGSMSDHSVPWKIYGYDKSPLTRLDFPDTTGAASTHFGLFTDFWADAAAGTLPAYAFLEPSWSSNGNSQHPNYDVALGEQLLLDTYRAVHDGPAWSSTLLIITYDEHGGCYDHVAPPAGATPPDHAVGEFGFDLTRFGLRVPTVLVSPLIEAGTVFRVPAGGVPLDHTSILATVQHRWSLPPLTARDAVAPDVSAVLSLATPRTDDPLTGITAPAASALPTALTGTPSHLQQVQADLASRLIIEGHTDGEPPLGLRTSTDYDQYINTRTEAWDATGGGG
jgi:phospholipase C